MLNVSAEVAGILARRASRALEPLEGIEQMERHRRPLGCSPSRAVQAASPHALPIDRSPTAQDLCAPARIWLGTITRRHPAPEAGRALGQKPGIGITARHLLRRFYRAAAPFVSVPPSLPS